MDLLMWERLLNSPSRNLSQNLLGLCNTQFENRFQDRATRRIATRSILNPNRNIPDITSYSERNKLDNFLTHHVHSEIDKVELRHIMLPRPATLRNVVTQTLSVLLIAVIFTGDPLHNRALAHSRALLFTQPCPHCSHSRAPGEQWARLCVFTLQGCVQAARLCRGSPVILQSMEENLSSTSEDRNKKWRSQRWSLQIAQNNWTFSFRLPTPTHMSAFCRKVRVGFFSIACISPIFNQIVTFLSLKWKFDSPKALHAKERLKKCPLF